jgi:membrane protein DedA with SNARE-associated domain
MPDLSELLHHWGYMAMFVVVVLGNVGLPVPEETVLALAGYLVHEGVLRLPLTLTVGVLAAVAGDNVGYWMGRRLGRPTIERYGACVGITPPRMERIEGFVTRYGALAVFAARFIPGVRILGGPLAGACGLRAFPFILANVLGALVYVPYAVGIGYALAWGLEPWLHRIERFFGKVEHVALLAVAVVVIVALVRRGAAAIRRRRSAR